MTHLESAGGCFVATFVVLGGVSWSLCCIVVVVVIVGGSVVGGGGCWWWCCR